MPLIKMLLPNLQAVATVTRLQSAGNANSNGTVLDLQTYKGPITFQVAVGQITTGLGAAHLNVANIEHSNDNFSSDAASVPNGGNFAAVVNAANVSNVGTQVKTFDTRDLKRYVRVRTEVSGTNANIPLTVDAWGQKERI